MIIMNNITPRAQHALHLAKAVAQEKGYERIGAHHLLAGLAGVGDKFGWAYADVKDQIDCVGAKPALKTEYGPDVKNILSLAGEIAKANGFSQVGTEIIALALFTKVNEKSLPTTQMILDQLKINPKEMAKQLMAGLKGEDKATSNPIGWADKKCNPCGETAGKPYYEFLIGKTIKSVEVETVRTEKTVYGPTGSQGVEGGCSTKTTILLTDGTKFVL